MVFPHFMKDTEVQQSDVPKYLAGDRRELEVRFTSVCLPNLKAAFNCLSAFLM